MVPSVLNILTHLVITTSMHFRRKKPDRTRQTERHAQVRQRNMVEK